MVETAQTVADWQISFPKWGVFVRAVALGVLSRMSLIGEGLSLGAGGTSRGCDRRASGRTNRISARSHPDRHPHPAHSPASRRCGNSRQTTLKDLASCTAQSRTLRVGCLSLGVGRRTLDMLLAARFFAICRSSCRPWGLTV
jgi:hypothetical protein